MAYTDVLADRTERNVFGYWHYNVVSLSQSVCLSSCPSCVTMCTVGLAKRSIT